VDFTTDEKGSLRAGEVAGTIESELLHSVFYRERSSFLSDSGHSGVQRVEHQATHGA
jgi:hypothetical protein